MMWVSNLIRTDMNVVMNCDFILFLFFKVEGTKL